MPDHLKQTIDKRFIIFYMLPIQNKRTVYWVHVGSMWREQEREPTEMQINDVRDRGGAIYFVPNELGDKRNQKNHLRDHANVVSFNAFFMDFDNGAKQEQMTRIRGIGLTPSAIVESGNGYHVYFEFEEPAILEPAAWSAVQTGLAKRFGGDTAVSDPARLMRLPGSYHTKDGSAPVLVHILEKNEVLYSPQTFIDLYPRPPIVTRARGRIGQVARIPSWHLPPNTRHPSLKRIAAALYGSTRSDAWPDLRTELKDWYVRSCTVLKPEWEHEVDSICDYYEYAERTKG